VLVFYVVLHRSGGDMRFTVTVAAVLFAALHLGSVWHLGAANPVVALQLIVAAVAGAAYTLSFALTGSLWAALVPHAANNAVALAFIVWQQLHDGAADADGSAVTCGSGGLVSAASAPLLASIACQIVVYVLAGAAAYRALVARATGVAPALQRLPLLIAPAIAPAAAGSAQPQAPAERHVAANPSKRPQAATAPPTPAADAVDAGVRAGRAWLRWAHPTVFD
jgi:hypothetical protein